MLFGVLSAAAAVFFIIISCRYTIFPIHYIEDHHKSYHMPPRVPASVDTVESIHRLADIVARFGADKEHIARESIAKNKFHFLRANADRIGFVYYEWVKGEKLLEKRRTEKMSHADDADDDNAAKKRQKRNPQKAEQQQQQHTTLTRRPRMKIAILDVVKTHL